MGIRRARPSDKNMVLDFCKDTFEWGDYIDRTWNDWISDTSGLLLIFETHSFRTKPQRNPIGMIHVIKCASNILWLEGLRVNKFYRNKGIATELVKYGINYGSKNGIREFGALVSKSNFASRKMLEKMGFSQLFDCKYYNVNFEKLSMHDKFLIESITAFSTNLSIKIPDLNDLSNIQRYLQNNKSRVNSDKYFNSWRFYDLDSSYSSLFSLIQNKELLVIVNQISEIVSVVIIKSMSKKIDNLYDKSTIQISYLHCFDLSIFFKLIHLLIDKYFDNYSLNNIYLLLPVFANLEKILNQESIESFDTFCLYSKNM